MRRLFGRVLLASLLLGGAARVSAQGATPEPAPVVTPRASSPIEAPPLAPWDGRDQNASSDYAGASATLPPTASTEAPVLFVAEGLEPPVPSADVRKRLADALGRELISLVDPRARRAQAVIWVAASDTHLVLRVTPPGRPEVWQKLARSSLGADPAGDVVRSVLEMFWADHFARIDAAEIQDPFCPRGMICLDRARRTPWPPAPEVEVLDPWDTSYRRFYGLDPFSYQYPPSAALSAPRPGEIVRGQDPYDSSRRSLEDYALDMLGGTGVHRGGAFVRYEVDALKRFPRFDFGLAFIAARGQPEPFGKARRAITAMLERRFASSMFELDLGAAFGTFFATLEGKPVQVRPYLRSNVRFALPLAHAFDLLVQSDLGTTFVSVPRAGWMEYSLSIGLRHRM